MNRSVVGLWCDFATLGGEFPLCSRELVFRFSPDSFSRYLYFQTEDQAINYLKIRNLEIDFTESIQQTDDGKYRLPYVFKDADDLWNTFVSQRKPKSLEYGAVYLTPDRDHVKTLPHFICYWPLVFDVDIDEYDELRSCKCKGHRYKVCDDCWEEFMQPAIRYLNQELTETFAFQAVLTVFSGRRGFHVWVLDYEVWSYTQKQREAIYAALNQVRFDMGVGTKPSHLLKAPLLVHPASKEKRMSIPIDDTFKPSLYPAKVNIQQCIEIIREKIQNGRKKK